MGRRSSVATVVTTGVSSPSSSTETSFRELDDVFLQTQTRIWLGEVLKIRLDEQLNLSDLLADGELLFEVSKTVWSLLLEKCVELRKIKAYQSPLGSKKSSGRYKPYSNVDSFLKVCKILGLNGIDLFSPSDVVEKRNTRKVCICIRAISKKARSKHLYVPDFDSVTYAVAMPTEMVGYIRRSLESSQCSVSSCCSSNNSYKQTSSRTQQRNLTSSPNGNCDSCSEESDEAESTYFGIEPSPEKSDHPSTLNLDLENLPDAFSAVKHYTTSQVSVQSDTQNYNRNGKPCLRQHLRNGLQNNPLSMKAQGDLDNKDMHTNNDLRDRSGNISELAEVDLVLGNEDPELRDYISDDLAGANYISDYLAFSDSVIFGNNGNILFPGGEDNVCDFFSSIDSHGLDSIQANSPNGFHQRSLDDMEDVEVSSTASMSSILGRALNMDFDDQYNGRDSSMVNVHNIIELHDKETDSREKFSITEDRSPASRQHDDVFSQCSTTESVEESCSAIHFETEGNHAKILSFPEEIVKPHIRESQKLDVCGDSLVPGIVFSMENASLAENHKSSRALDLKKVVSCVSDLSPNFNHESSNDTSLDSVHHEICMEGKVSCHKGSLEGNGSLVCSLGNEDVIPVKLAGCLESHELQNGTISSHNFTCPVNEHDSRTENAPISNNDNGKIVTGGGHQTYTDNSRTAHQSSIGNKDIGNGINVGTSNEKFSNEIDDRYARQENPRRNLLLNTVVTGTTLIGALFFLLHIRKGKERIDKPPVLMKAQQFGGTKPASRRGQTNKSTGTYPAEKLKFGN